MKEGKAAALAEVERAHHLNESSPGPEEEVLARERVSGEREGETIGSAAKFEPKVFHLKTNRDALLRRRRVLVEEAAGGTREDGIGSG